MDKKSFRKVCFQKLKRTAQKPLYPRDHLLIRKIEAILKKERPSSVLLYLPMGHEPDIRPLFGRLRSKMRIYVPFMHGKSFKLVKYRLPLYKKKYGIYEPNDSFFYRPKIEMAIVPVLGVDGRMRRIGFGKGMYDRFFATLKKQPKTIFVQRIKCTTHEVVTDDYDVVADLYITPEEIITRGKNNVDRIDDRRCRRHR